MPGELAGQTLVMASVKDDFNVSVPVKPFLEVTCKKDFKDFIMRPLNVFNGYFLDRAMKCIKKMSLDE